MSAQSQVTHKKHNERQECNQSDDHTSIVSCFCLKMPLVCFCFILLVNQDFVCDMLYEILNILYCFLSPNKTFWLIFLLRLLIHSWQVSQLQRFNLLIFFLLKTSSIYDARYCPARVGNARF